MEKLKVLSLFCGCGGMDLGLIGGFKYQGVTYGKHDFDIVQAIDNDPYCTKIYNANFSHPCEVRDVRSIDIASLPDIDMLIGGFPCQSFSISAQNPPRLGCKDERGMLFFEMVRILKAKQPRFFIAENVKGLLSANKHKAFPMIIKEFEDAGYKVRYQLLNASNYGVPQKRERVIIVGFRELDDYLAFNYPPMETAKKAVLGDVIDECENQNERLFFSEKAVAGMMAKREKMNKGRVQNLDEPCNTISSHLAKVSLNSTDPVLMINGRYRRFSCRETARIQSFPENFKFDVVSDSKQYKAIGNAVPPVMMWHVAKALQKCIQKSNVKCGQPHPTKQYSNGDYVQLALFEPETLYIAQSRQMLVGTCRQSTRHWIKDNGLYNYPVTDEELKLHPELLDVSSVVVKYRKSIVGYFNVQGIEVIDRQRLKELGYPVRSSKNKAEAKYILYKLQPSEKEIPAISANDLTQITGKGVKTVEMDFN